MRQILEVKVPIQIPKEYRLISIDEYDTLKSQSMVGRMWNMKDLRNWLGGKSPDWIKDNIIYNPRYAKEIRGMRLKRELVGGGRGRPFKFKASVIANFVEKHWQELAWER